MNRPLLSRRLICLLLCPLLCSVFLYLPDPLLRQMRLGREGVVLTDRGGQPLYSIPTRDGGYQHRLSWDQIPVNVQHTFLRLEDRRFYSHFGVDPLAAARAAVSNLRQRRIVSGASTITMQLARLIHPHEGGLPGKVAEVLRALYLETHLSKQQILLLYLNNLPFGYNTLGVGAAARLYFSQPLHDLTPAQILLLAVIPKAPSLYDPFGSVENRSALRKRALSLAAQLSITPEQIDRAMDTFLRGAPEFRAPHFVRYILENLEEQIPEQADGVGIVRITTTLDIGLYEKVNRTIRSRLAAVAGDSTTRGGVNTVGAGLHNAAALVVNNNSGQVLVWIGSQDFFDSANGGQIDGVRRKSSSGSTLKPFLYAAALQRSFTASSLLPDLALTFGAREGYRPENFDRRSRGLVRLRTALASSLNVPAVYVLSQIGLEEFLSTCIELGFELPEDVKARTGLGAAVGNLEVSLLELVRAFSVFPNGGQLPPVRIILEVTTARGRRIPALNSNRSKRIFSEQTAWLISHMLADPAARASGFGTGSRFNTAFPALFKSGTASEYTSLWCVGGLPKYTMGVWAGNFDGRSAFGVTGSSLPAAVVVQVLKDLSREGTDQEDSSDLAQPHGLSTARICVQTGYRAAPGCPATREEYFLTGSEPEAVCPVHGSGMTVDELLLRILLGEGRQARIVFPRNGMIFYRDRSTEATRQTIPGWVVADPSDRITVRLNGRDLPFDDPSRVLLPVEPGRFRLQVQGRFGSDAVTYSVR